MSPAYRLAKVQRAAPTSEELGELSRFLHQSIGMTIDAARLKRIMFKIERRLDELEISEWAAYLHLAQNEYEEFLNLAAFATVNKTHFFREERHFEILKSHAEASLQSHHKGRFLCWSAACSTGEEVYSLAITLEELRRRSGISAWNFGVLGTDVNYRVLEQAKQGVYAEEVVRREVPQALMKTYFLRGRQANEGLFRISPDLYHHTKFRFYNLLQADAINQISFDAIFLRNVLIYFDKDVQRQVLRNILRQLKSGGLLFLGHCERLPEGIDGLKNLGSSVYSWKGTGL